MKTNIKEKSILEMVTDVKRIFNINQRAIIRIKRIDNNRVMHEVKFIEGSE